MFAGSTLFLAMVVSIPILPGALLVSLAGTLIVVVILSVSVATIVAPALLALLGPNVNRWQIGRRRRDRSHGGDDLRRRRPAAPGIRRRR